MPLFTGEELLNGWKITKNRALTKTGGTSETARESAANISFWLPLFGVIYGKSSSNTALYRQTATENLLPLRKGKAILFSFAGNAARVTDS